MFLINSSPPKPRAEGSNPSAPARENRADKPFARFLFTLFGFPKWVSVKKSPPLRPLIQNDIIKAYHKERRNQNDSGKTKGRKL